MSRDYDAHPDEGPEIDGDDYAEQERENERRMLHGVEAPEEPPYCDRCGGAHNPLARCPEFREEDDE